MLSYLSLLRSEIFLLAWAVMLQIIIIAILRHHLAPHRLEMCIRVPIQQRSLQIALCFTLSDCFNVTYIFSLGVSYIFIYIF